MKAADQSIGYLFPAGGPVPSELIIGREVALAELDGRIREGIHTLLTGPRRIGKTTICDAVCERLEGEGAVVIKVEVPEAGDASGFLTEIVERSRRQQSALETGRRVFKVAEPLLESILAEQGLPLELSGFERAPAAETARKVLALPRRFAERSKQPVVFYLDEIQRVVDYKGGGQLLHDLVDLYSGQTGAVLLVDGSDERAMEGMMVPPVGFGKLVDRLPLAVEIPARIWRHSLPERFERAGLTIEPEALDDLNEFGRGHPHATMTAARHAAFNARKLGTDSVGIFEMTEGIEEARRHLEEDGQ